METNFLIKGVIIGFLIAAPVGPIGVLCIKRSFSKGALSGLLTGLGAATADACYGAIAAFGLTLISDFLIGQKVTLQILGIIFLLYLGIKTFIENPASEAKGKVNGKGLLSDYLTTVGLTLTNPTTIASFVAVFAGIGITAAANYTDATLLVLGVFLGSAAWWLILSNGVGLLRKKANNNLLKWVNRISGTIIVCFAIVLFINLILS
jgi:threonine/homoserine/homoserine lactone efflux protein